MTLFLNSYIIELFYYICAIFQLIMAHNYEEIVREWYCKLQPEFLRRLTSRYSRLTLADAENLYQDAFIAVYENLKAGKIKDETSWSNYIFRIGMNLASKEWRKAGLTDSFDAAGDNEYSDTSTGTPRKIEDILKNLPENETEIALVKDPTAQSLLGEELAHIPEPCNTILVLFYYEQLPMQQIAIRTGYKNATTAKSKKSQCMKDLINRITKTFRREGLI